MIIKFNLLPPEKAKKRIEPSINFNKIFVGVISGILIIAIVLIGFLEFKSYKLAKEVRKETAILRKYKHIAQEVKRLQRQTEEIKNRIVIMLRLRNYQRTQMEKFDYLLRNIGSNALYLTDLTFFPDKAVVKGMSLTLNDIANYLSGLEKNSKLVYWANVRNIRRNENFLQFDINVKFRK
ncbi:MAG: hypothetical protein GXO57_03710 [Thermodesulfobacteria bacterium]|nr:hypothetical protein [Thermodesulfobacteriota bacterium]